MNRRYDTLLFDVDNTLLDFDANEAESFRRMMGDLGETYTEEIYKTYHAMNEELWRKLERKEIALQEVLDNRFSWLMERYGKQVDGVVWEKTYRKYLNRGTQEMPGVRPVLDALRGRYRLYVITNGMTDTQEYRMGASGLAAYFDQCFISEQIGASKPSKEFFDHVKSRISQFDAARTLVIGDSLTSDIKGGHDAGTDTCWICRNPEAKPGEERPTYRIRELSELLAILEG